MQDNTMPQAVAKANYVRIAPRKVQIVLDLIRNQPADKALAILKHTPKAACEPLLKLLKSAIANAENKNKKIIIMPAVRLPQLSMRFRQNSQMPTGRPPIRRIILPLSDNSARIILSLLLTKKSRHCFSPNHSLTLSSSLSA